MNPKSKILVIVGPTASGKSDLAVKLAKKYNGEVISADSRQVYRGMDIGSGKITEKEMAGLPHHLLDVADPKRTYSVAQYQKLAHKTIAEILSRGKLPIIVGGTGLYIQSIIDDLALPEVAPNAKLRKELDKKAPAELFTILKKLDPNRAKNIDPNNPRRLVRAIEIAEFLGHVPPLKKTERYNTLQIGLQADMPNLDKKITLRLSKRLKQGMLAEVKQLKKTGVSWRRLENFGLEYRFIARFLRGQISKTEMIESIKSESLKYAKRQMSWFKKDKRIVWIKKPSEAEKLTGKFLGK